MQVTIDNIDYNVDETIKILGENEEKVFTQCPGVIFDSQSKNFHIFPENEEVYNELYEKIRIVYTKILEKCGLEQRETIKKFQKRLTSNVNISIHQTGIIIIPYGTNINAIKKNTKIEEQHIYCCIGAGSGEFVKYNNCMNEKRNNIYKYITMYHNGAWYTLNFLRMYCENNRVGCAFNALQYRRNVGSKANQVNIGNSKKFDICYPETFNDGECCINNAGNICYNPHTRFDADVEVILNDFLKFIKIGDGIGEYTEDYIKNNMKTSQQNN